jgi:hypothetical protein
LEKWEEASTKASIVIAIDCTMLNLFTNCNKRVKILNLFHYKQRHVRSLFGRLHNAGEMRDHFFVAY